MTDIVERLRLRAWRMDCEEAADEIERLRADNANERYEAGMYQALYENAQAEIKRLRAVLEMKCQPNQINNGCP